MADTRTVGALADIHTYCPYVIQNGIDPPQFCIPTEQSEGTYVKRTWDGSRNQFPVSDNSHLSSTARVSTTCQFRPSYSMKSWKLSRLFFPAPYTHQVVILPIPNFINRGLEQPPLFGEVSANFCGERVSRGQRNGSPRPLIRFS
jgi:hypothetical protein